MGREPGGFECAPVEAECAESAWQREVVFLAQDQTVPEPEAIEDLALELIETALSLLPHDDRARGVAETASNFSDVHRFMRFAAEFIDLREVPDDLPPRTSVEAPRASQSASTADMPLSPTSIICQPSPAWKGSPAWKRIGTVAPSIFLPSRQVVPVPTL